MTNDELFATIRKCWDANTSVNDTWSPDNPSAGQCAVTALVVQDYLGGKLKRMYVDDVSHYFNLLDDGTLIDLTQDQFGNTEGLYGIIITRDRDYVLSFPDTVRRYDILRLRVAFQLPSNV